MAKIDRIYEAVDDYGLITAAEASDLGMAKAEIVQQANLGKLVRVARGVYRMPVWPFQAEAPYAIAVKAAGEGAFLYGESVVALLGLAPTDPAKMWIATPRRCRRDLGSGVRIVRADGTQPEWVEGILCQPVADAIEAASRTLGAQRARRAASEALRRGLITPAEASALERGLRDDETTEQHASS